MQSELLASKLEGWNLGNLLSLLNNIMNCNHVNFLLDLLGQYQNPMKWIFFIDFSKMSFKAVLLHNGNKNQSSCLCSTNKEDIIDCYWMYNMKSILGTYMPRM